MADDANSRRPRWLRRRLLQGTGAAALVALDRTLANASVADGGDAVPPVPAVGSDLRIAAAPAPVRAPAAPSRAPVLFIGHGSPMNTLRDTPYTRALRALGPTLGKPRAVIVVSAHWLTEGGTLVSTLERPPTIHDFSGFPDALNTFEYAAPGSPLLAREAAHRIREGRVMPAGVWGLDHGAWSVLHHLFPGADVPVFQVSIDWRQPGAHHLAVGRDLAAFRDLGVLIVASGNIAHNLRMTMPGTPDAPRAGAPWAQAWDDAVVRALEARDVGALANYRALDASSQSAVATPDHYFPLLYAVGAALSADMLRYVWEGFESGTVSMRSLQFG
ncbi:MAG: 4,5-DOPA dioxygenase extradiol [Proteobacteria bacterium]|nr:4,5-DOPA dioxygenase extradiol [Pseudomonadota bacterium]